MLRPSREIQIITMWRPKAREKPSFSRRTKSRLQPALQLQRSPKNKVWTFEQVELVLRYIKDYKTKCDFSGIDLQADLASMYTEIRRCMAVDFPDDFGPEVLTEPTKSLKAMSEEEHEAFKRQRDTERSQTKKGYDRVKEKIRNVRQDFRAAVSKGTRSGSGKIVQENFELLSEIWGGSPATTSLSFGIDADLLGTDKSLEIDVESPEGIYFSLALLNFFN